MPIANMVILAGIVLAFIVFAAILAWGDYQSRLAGRDAGQQTRLAGQVHLLKQVAQDTGRKGPIRAQAGADPTIGPSS
jgi:hypothetical protein